MRIVDFNLESVGPPSGGVILFHMLKILEGYNFTSQDSESDLMYHRMVEVRLGPEAVFHLSSHFGQQSQLHSSNRFIILYCIVNRDIGLGTNLHNL